MTTHPQRRQHETRVAPCIDTRPVRTGTTRIKTHPNKNPHDLKSRTILNSNQYKPAERTPAQPTQPDNPTYERPPNQNSPYEHQPTTRQNLIIRQTNTGQTKWPPAKQNRPNRTPAEADHRLNHRKQMKTRQTNPPSPKQQPARHPRIVTRRNRARRPRQPQELRTCQRGALVLRLSVCTHNPRTETPDPPNEICQTKPGNGDAQCKTPETPDRTTHPPKRQSDAPPDLKTIQHQLDPAMILFPSVMESTRRRDAFESHFSSICEAPAGGLPNKTSVYPDLDLLRRDLVNHYMSVEATLSHSINLSASKDQIYDNFRTIFTLYQESTFTLAFIPDLKRGDAEMAKGRNG
ncbi:hypothetical protein BS47DRAFT_1449915 [Hydnum rufescens UP504]|uniref:Uncharacterized protein n=1 Tax=Hydnum rufescens UP504 TaxID=1448309 RepID=A0A9P6B0M5_9AGAM|nr:hypothetical protein BS47DRAFT_1449915 [Hydnum rufescens UP504]